MSERPTNTLDGSRSFEERVFARFDGLDQWRRQVDDWRGQLDRRLDRMENGLQRLDARLTAVEAMVEALEDEIDTRLRETRPIWEAVQTRLEHMDTKFDKVILDLYETRTDVGVLDKRVTRLENITPA